MQDRTHYCNSLTVVGLLGLLCPAIALAAAHRFHAARTRRRHYGTGGQELRHRALEHSL